MVSKLEANTLLDGKGLLYEDFCIFWERDLPGGI